MDFSAADVIQSASRGVNFSHRWSLISPSSSNSPCGSLFCYRAAYHRWSRYCPHSYQRPSDHRLLYQAPAPQQTAEESLLHRLVVPGIIIHANQWRLPHSQPVVPTAQAHEPDWRQSLLWSHSLSPPRHAEQQFKNKYGDDTSHGRNIQYSIVVAVQCHKRR